MKKPSFVPNNWILTKWTQYPDWVVSIVEETQNLFKTHKVHDTIKYAGRSMTIGQYLVFRVLENVGFTWSEAKSFFPLTKKNIKKLLTKIYEKESDSIKALWAYWLLQYIGFQIGTKYPVSYSPKDFNIPEKILQEKNKLISMLRDGKIDAETFENEMKKLAKELVDEYNQQGLTIADIIFSGAAKNEIPNIQRMMIARGLSITSEGKVNAVVTSSLAEGAKPEDYVAGTSEAITSLYAKSHFTASGGYLSRLLSELTGALKISEETSDCGSKNYLEIHIDSADLAKAVVNRYDSSKKLITTPPKVGTKVKLRSPLYCLAKDGICETCLGTHFKKLGLGPGDPLIITSTAIGDALTAVALKRSHSGSSLNAEPIDFKKEIFG